MTLTETLAYVDEAQKSAAAEATAHLPFGELAPALQGRIHLRKPSAESSLFVHGEWQR